MSVARRISVARTTLIARAIVFAILPAGMMGCAQEGKTDRVIQISYTDYTTLYTPGMVQYAVPKGEMTTVVRGNPFPAGPADPDAIAGAVPPPGWLSPPIRFTTKPGPGTPENYKLVLIFTPGSPGAGDDQTCADPAATPVGPGGGPVTLQATFCAGDRWVSHLVAYGPAVTGLGDRQFQTILAQVSILLFPSSTPDQMRPFRPCKPPFCM